MAAKETDQFDNGSDTLLDVCDLWKLFPSSRGLLKSPGPPVRAVENVSFSIQDGEAFGLVGESGCGKTTVLRCIVRAIPPTSGRVMFRTESGPVVDLATLTHRQLRPLRPEIQMIFQNPFTSLNPRMRLLDIIGEPLLLQGMKNRQQRVERVKQLLGLVGLPDEYLGRFPHAFSGGERQRIGIARALATHPRLVVADEPLSALDVSVQAQVLNLMRDLQRQLKLTFLLVSHDLGVVRHFCDRVAVMYAGQIVEMAAVEDIFASPKHPYTAALLESVPEPDPRGRESLRVLGGEVPNPAAPPSGCRFHPRCPHATDTCRQAVPLWESAGPDHWVACHHADTWPRTEGGRVYDSDEGMTKDK